jgi:hypothetical protein
MKKYLYILLALTAFSSCKKFLDVNTDPNKPTDVPPKLLLPTTTVGMGWANGNELGRAAGVLIQYNAGLGTTTNPAIYDTYVLDGGMDNQWNSEIYGGTVTNLRILISKTNGTSPAYSGIAKLELAYVISMATDLWGDVPYSQAGFGVTYPQPRFDKQQDIYLGNSTLGIQSLFNLVREGIADLDKTSALKPTSDDLIYAGDLAKWKRMGNTLLLKLALQVSNVAKDTTISVINSALASTAGLISDSTYDFKLPFLSTAVGNKNPYFLYDYTNRPDEEMASTRFINLMKSQNDTLRLAKFYTKPNGVFTGYDNGAVTTTPAAANRSRYNTYVVGTNGEAPLRLITSFQRAFILAEAALTLGIAGDPNALYQEGIRMSMQKVGMTPTEITTYFAANPLVVNLTGTTPDKLKQIITQKYISLVGNGIEAYNDYRRTGYPVLALSLKAGGDDPSSIPKRFAYQPGEATRNPNQPNPRIKTNVKVWWGL